MATLVNSTCFASYFCLLLAGCGVDSDVVVDKESAHTLDVLEQTPNTEGKAAAAVSEVSIVKSFVPLAEPLDDAVDLLEPLTFTVVTYNVENLFDADGVSIFDDYKVNSGYTPRKLLTKLQTIASVLKSVDGGDTPELSSFKS